uniref:Canopy FGF signaling regulator 2 n=4 Tax=Boreoeutheria TaxID=1437010 RepID=F7DEN7_HORSE
PPSYTIPGSVLASGHSYSSADPWWSRGAARHASLGPSAIHRGPHCLGAAPKAACSRESLEGRVWGRSLAWGLHRSASELCLGSQLRCRELGQAVAGAPRVWKAPERSLEKPGQPRSPSQVLGSGAESESPAVFQRLGHGGGPGSRACRALVDELEWEIAQVDPKKTIQMGSFRINPDGSQSVVEVPYARSEAHLTELLEEVCDRMKEYGEQIDPSTHRKNYVRVVGRNGESSELDLQGIRIDSDISGTLKFACESIVEEYEDELIEFFSREADNVKDKLCSKRTDLCDHALHISHDEL